MGLELTPIDTAHLSPAVVKVLTGPARAMAAKGVVPMPTPGELVTALYQLALDAEQGIAEAARGTARTLPEKVLAGVVGDTRLDPRVLDWIAPRALGAPALFNSLVNNTTLADETMATLAARASDREVDQIATNEQRMLRFPDIIAAMYTNPYARMSTVDRAVELAVRNQVRVPGLAAWDEIARALDADGRADAERDRRFAQVAAAVTGGDDSVLTRGDAENFNVEDAAELELHLDKATEDVKKPIGEMKVSEKIRLAMLGDGIARAVLIRDPMKIVAIATIKAPKVTDIEAARFAGMSSLHEEVIRYIATRREWTRLYGIKLSLSMNPKTPIHETSRLLPHLREKDLVKVAKSKGVPSAVVSQARKLMMQRSGGKR